MIKKFITYILLLLFVSCTADVIPSVEEKHEDDLDNKIHIVIPVSQFYSAKKNFRNPSFKKSSSISIPFVKSPSLPPSVEDDPGRNDGKCHIFILGVVKEPMRVSEGKEVYALRGLHPASFSAQVAIDFSTIEGLTSKSVISIEGKNVNVRASSDKTSDILGSGELTFDNYIAVDGEADKLVPRSNDMCYPLDKNLCFDLYMYVSDGGWSVKNERAKLRDFSIKDAQIYVTGDNKLYMGVSSDRDAAIKFEQRKEIIKFELDPLLSTIEFDFTRTKNFPKDTDISRISVGNFYYLFKLNPLSQSFFPVKATLAGEDDSKYKTPMVRHCPVKKEKNKNNQDIFVWYPFEFDDDNTAKLAVHVSNVALKDQIEAIPTDIETLVKRYTANSQGQVTKYDTSFNIYTIELKCKNNGAFAQAKNYRVSVKLDAIKDALNNLDSNDESNWVVKPWIDEIIESDPENTDSFPVIK